MYLRVRTGPAPELIVATTPRNCGRRLPSAVRRAARVDGHLERCEGSPAAGTSTSVSAPSRHSGRTWSRVCTGEPFGSLSTGRRAEHVTRSTGVRASTSATVTVPVRRSAPGNTTALRLPGRVFGCRQDRRADGHRATVRPLPRAAPRSIPSVAPDRSANAASAASGSGSANETAVPRRSAVRIRCVQAIVSPGGPGLHKIVDQMVRLAECRRTGVPPRTEWTPTRRAVCSCGQPTSGW